MDLKIKGKNWLPLPLTCKHRMKQEARSRSSPRQDHNNPPRLPTAASKTFPLSISNHPNKGHGPSCDGCHGHLGQKRIATIAPRAILLLRKRTTRRNLPPLPLPLLQPAHQSPPPTHTTHPPLLRLSPHSPTNANTPTGTPSSMPPTGPSSQSPETSSPPFS